MPYPYDASDLAAITRLGSYYSGSAYDAGSNPGGMAAGGHRTNFIPSLQDLALIADAIADAADAADDSATSASSSATAAAASAAALAGTSTTSVSIGTGTKSFTTQTSKSFSAGTWLNIRSAANPTLNYMIGQSTSYNSGTGALTVTVPTGATSGSGSYTDWTIDVSAAPGQTGATGATGAQGPVPAVQWNFSNGTGDSDPGNGLIKLNNTTTSSVTYLYIDNLDKDGTTITAWLDALDDSTNTTNRGRVHIREINTPTNFVEFIVTGVVVDGTGYRKVPVTYVSASNASAVPFTNGAAVGLVFGPAGNRGADGAGAGDFIGPASSVENNIIIFGDTTGKLGEDSGVGISTSGANVGRLDGANTYSGAQSYAATVDLQQQLKLSGDITPTQLSANTDDWAPTGLSTCSVIRVSTDASRNLTGLTGGADGRIIILHNVGSFDLVLKDNVTSTTANRFSFGADYYLHAGQTIAMIYDATATRWKALSYVGVGAQFITATSTQALAVGIAGATNPAFQVDTYSGGAIVSGIKITGTGTGVAPQLSVISSDTNLSLAIDAKGSGAITFGATSTGAIQFSRSAVPTSSDGAALGTTALMWSDLFLASGGVVNFNNGDVTITHASNALTIAGGTLSTSDSTAATAYNAASVMIGGGLGVAGAIHCAGAIRPATSTGFGSIGIWQGTNTLTLSGGTSGIAFNNSANSLQIAIMNDTGDLALASTTASSSTTTGALKVGGGLGVAGAVYGGAIASFASGQVQMSTSENLGPSSNSLGYTSANGYGWTLKNTGTSGVRGMLQFFDGADSSCGTILIDATANTTSFNTTSDGNLKDVLGAINLTDEIDRLRPIMFKWKDKPDGAPMPGFVAQEVYEVWPSAVTPGGEDCPTRITMKDETTGELLDMGPTLPHWQMDAAKLMPLVVAELQLLRARVKSLGG